MLREEFSKHDIKGAITVLKNAIANIFKPSDDGTAVIYHMYNDFHAYDFRLDRPISEAEAEVILELIEKWVDGDFEMEVTTSEQYDLPEGETESDLTAMKHNRWVSKQVSEGWRYGLQFDIRQKTDPRLRPYHELTEKLKNI